MNVLIVLVSALAVASAGYLSPYAGHGGPIHVPVIGHNGVPVDTPEVQHARAAHFAALAEAGSRGGHGGNGGYDDGSYRGDGGSYRGDDGSYRGDEGAIGHGGQYTGHHATPHAYPTTHGIAHVTHDGVPLNTPEVNAAAAHHFAAYGEALARAGSHGYGGAHYRKRRSIYGHGAYHGPIHIPVIGHNGVPIDTPEVQHARAAHLAALAGHGGVNGGYYAQGAPVSAYAGTAHWDYLGVPAIAHDGTPLDTAEVAHAKEAHFAAYNEAASRNGVHGYAGVQLGYAAPWGQYSNGAPSDTPEVAHAKAAHFAAHAAARGHQY